MKKILISLAIITAIFIGCKTNTKSADSKTLTITLEPKSNSTVTGTATFTEKNGKVTFVAKMAGLEPGVHAIHIHEKSDCTAADGSSAGGHWNPTFKKHGKWGVGEYHKGDIGNFTADAKGNGTITMTTDEWSIGGDDETKNILGKGLIVHQGADDFTSQPAGNAGARVACSGIIK
ncbi:superoxide dismutase family protein [Flavobacterium sp. Fl-77]|uniref:Superoxide dismutase [Cu-Zn] n=1 Tax=Flavobacterium flavipigmentatum TaxID=2893884 RepID=A0AAJ2VZQ0_9FLAO|nr:MULTISPECIES: superoxide dismutase family protein [unclassified Flavobacterium]MDX6184006.1 superoxide dismutase family protein [Flavobacterium sp. Fl-33]MDX6187559.1 superoxide dismutase family protein [Flavobacterium sp. Fl-77]UFH38452.1 superoxide dismutase family protein [Flavobacterium sp. F-70]